MNDIPERAARLSQETVPTRRLEEISDLRERVEVVHTSQYAVFLQHLYPVFEKYLLETVPPSFRSDDPNQKVRMKILEIMNRLPLNDSLRPYARKLFTTCLDVIQRDNEENALTAFRIVFELERSFPNNLEPEATKFLELVRKLYTNLEESVNIAFSEESIKTGAEKACPSEAEGSYIILNGMNSFRVMFECPLIVMLLFQLNAPLASSGVPILLPFMFKGLAVRIPSTALNQKLEGKELRVRQFRFESLLSCQVKTLSFLTYLLLSFADQIISHEAEVAYHVVTLLRIVPSECISIRRELLVATRHILATECNRGFYPYLNAMLDEAVLLGVPTGRFDLAAVPFPKSIPQSNSAQAQVLSSNSGAQPTRIPTRKQPLVNLAFTALADLVQTMRGQMEISQLSRVVYLFSRNLHDPCLPLSTQITSARLLLNLVDGIYHHREPNNRELGPQGLLVKILDALARKLGTLRFLIPKITALEHATENQPTTTSASAGLPMESFLFVKTQAPGSVDNGEKRTIERTHSIGSVNEASIGEVISIPVFSGGHQGIRKKRPSNADAGLAPADRRELDRAYIIGISSDDPTNDASATNSTPETLRDVCSLIRPIITGMKTLFYTITKAEQHASASAGPSPQAAQQKGAAAGKSPPPPQSQQPPKTPNLSEEEVRLIGEVFSWTLQCLPAFRAQKAPELTPSEIELEENELIESFANAFTVLEPCVFTDVIQSKMEFFYCCMVRNRRVAHIALHFLRSPSVSRSFASILIPFLLSRFSLVCGRHVPIYSSLEQEVVDALIQKKLGEGEEGEEEFSWPYLCAPPSKMMPPKLYEATYFGGAAAPKLDVSRVPATGLSAVDSFEGLGVPSPDVWPSVTNKVKLEDLPKDDEAYLLFKLHKTVFTTISQLVRNPPPPAPMNANANGAAAPQQHGYTESLIALLLAYLEPTVFACLTRAAETIAFPLEGIRSGTIKDEDDTADNCILCVKSMLSVAIDANAEVRDAVAPLVRRVAKPIVRAVNSLLIVSLQKQNDTASLSRADNLSDLCVQLAFSLTDEPNLLALPFSHALTGLNRGNEQLVSKTLATLERLVAPGVFERIGLARGGLVNRALRPLLKTAFASNALRLHGKSNYEVGAQSFSAENSLSGIGQPVLSISVTWMGSSDKSEMDLTETAKAICRYLEDTFVPVRKSTTALHPDAPEVYQKQQGVEFLSHLIKSTNKEALSVYHEVLDALITCAADVHVNALASTVIAELLKKEKMLLGEAIARAFCTGCPHRCLYAQNLLLTTLSEETQNEHLISGFISVLIDRAQNQSWQDRTGAFFGLKVLMKSSVGQKESLKHEETLVSCFVGGFKDHANEYGIDVLTHLGDGLHLFIKHVGSRMSEASITTFVRCLSSCEDSRARRVLRGALYLIFSFRKEELFRCIIQFLPSVNLTLKSEMSSFSCLAAKAEFFLFFHEIFAADDDIGMERMKLVVAGFEFLQDVINRNRKFLMEEPDDNALNDIEYYPFTYHPRVAVFKTALLRLARRVCCLRIESLMNTKSMKEDLLGFCFSSVSSTWPTLSRAAETLLQSLTFLDQIQPTLRQFGQDYISRIDVNRGTMLSLNFVRGADRILGALENTCRIVKEGFAQELYSILIERADAVKVFSSTTRKTFPGEELILNGCLIELYCKLPSSMALPFLEHLIQIVVRTEQNLHFFHSSYFPTNIPNVTAPTGKPLGIKALIGTNCGARLTSPLRTPIARFFALFPAQSLEHLFSGDRLIKRTYSALLADLIRRRDDGEPLRKEILQNPSVLRALMVATFDAVYETPPDANRGQHTVEQSLRRAQARVVELRFQGVRLVRSIAKWGPDVIAKCPDLITSVIGVMKSPDRSESRVITEEKLPLRHRTLCRIACKTVIAAFKAGGPIAPICELLPIAMLRSTTDNTFLFDFFSRTLPKLDPPQMCEILVNFTNLLMDNRTTIALKEAILRIVLIPLLSGAYTRKLTKGISTNFPEESMKVLIQLVLTDRKSIQMEQPTNFGPASVGEDLEVQLLQLSTLLIAHDGKLLMPYRKELIRFAWAHLNGEDSPSKNWAYLNICTFIDVYQTPPDIILQVYVELLRAHSAEARELVCRALDMLTPALHRRMEVGKYIKAIKWTKKLLFDDGHHLSQLTHVWQMVTHHPQIFYQYRAQFIPQMVNSLNRVGLPHNCPIENRELAINLSELVLSWERTREVEETNLQSGESINSREDVARAFRLNSTMFGMVLSFLLRVALQLVDSRDPRPKALAKRCVVLFNSALELAKKRCSNRVSIAFSAIAKAVATQAKKYQATTDHDIQLIKKHFSDSTPATEKTRPPPAPWDRRADYGVMCCSLELLESIVSADEKYIALPFLQENAGDLHIIIDPSFASPEKEATLYLIKFVSKLLEFGDRVSSLNDLSERKEEEEEMGTTSANAKPFLPTFQEALILRLTLTEEKKSPTAPNENIATSTTGTRSIPTTRTNNTNTAQITKVFATRIAKEISLRQAEYIGAGPKGMIMLLKMVQVLCGCNDPPPFPLEPSISISIGNPALTEKFASLLMKLATRMARELVTANHPSSRNSSSTSKSSVADFVADELNPSQRNKPLTSQILELCLSLLGGITLTSDAHRRQFMQLMASLFDKLEASDHVILRRMVKILKGWFNSKNGLNGRERVAFWSKLSALDTRLAGLLDTSNLMQDIHDLVLHSPAPHPRSALFAGTLSPSPSQRNSFWTTNFPAQPPSSDLMHNFFIGRRDDFMFISHKFWLPLAVRYLIESRLISQLENPIFYHLSQVCFGDGSGDVAVHAWSDCLQSVWGSSRPEIRRSFVDSISSFLLTLPNRLIVSSTGNFESKRLAHLFAPPTLGPFRLALSVKRIERSFMLCRFSTPKILFSSICQLPEFSYFSSPEVIRFVGNTLEEKINAILAVEETFESHKERAADTLMTLYNEIGDDNACQGVLRAMFPKAKLDQGLNLELQGRWKEAFELYQSEAIKLSPDKEMVNLTKLGTVRSLEDFKRLRLVVAKGNEDTADDTDDDQEGDESRIIVPSWLEMKGWESRLRKCVSSLGDWQTVYQLGKQENDTVLMIDALSRKLDLLTPSRLEEVRRSHQFYRNLNSDMELAFLELISAIKENKTMPELEESLKRTIKFILHSHQIPGKAVTQRLVELEESLHFLARMSRMNSESRISTLRQVYTTWQNRGPPIAFSTHEWAAIVSWREEFWKVVGSPPELKDGSIVQDLYAARHARTKGALDFAYFYLLSAQKKSPGVVIANEVGYELVRTRISREVTLPQLATAYQELENVLNGQAEKHPEHYRLEARMFALAKKNPVLIEETYCAGLKLEPNNSKIWLDWGRYLYDVGQKSDAAICIAKAIALNHTSARLLFPALFETEGGAINQLSSLSSPLLVPWISTILASSQTPFARHALERILIMNEPQALMHEIVFAMKHFNTPQLANVLPAIRKAHYEIVQELEYLSSIIEQKLPLKDWRPRTLRIPGTRRPVDNVKYIISPKTKAITHVEFYSDDGRAEIRFLIHTKPESKEKRKIYASIYVLTVVMQDGGLGENISPPAVYGLLGNDITLEKETGSLSLNSIVQTSLNWFEPSKPVHNDPKLLKRWFFRQFSDVEKSFIARRRLVKQYAFHAFVTQLLGLSGSPKEVMIGKGVEAVFAIAGADDGGISKEGRPSFRLTPYLQELFTIHGIYGNFLISLSSAARIASGKDAKSTLLIDLGEQIVGNNSEILNEDSIVRDGKVQAMLQESMNYKGLGVDDPWMAWM